MSSLVDRLSQGQHPVSLARYKNARDLQEAIGRDFILVKFTETKGGTELGFKIDKMKSRIDLDDKKETLKLVGSLTLDYVPVECSVDIDKESLLGTGHLTVLPA